MKALNKEKEKWRVEREDLRDKPRSKREADSIKLDSVPAAAPEFPDWKIRLRSAVHEASNRDDEEAFRWACEIEAPEATLESMGDPGRFGTLDTKLSAALDRAAKHSEAAPELKLKMEELARMSPPQALKGRQKAWMIYQSFKVDEQRGFMYGYEDLQAVRCANEQDLPRFWAQW